MNENAKSESERLKQVDHLIVFPNGNMVALRNGEQVPEMQRATLAEILVSVAQIYGCDIRNAKISLPKIYDQPLWEFGDHLFFADTKGRRGE